MRKIVYLDQNKWIDLLKQRNGQLPDHYPDLSTALETVERTATHDEVLYPIDFLRLGETAAMNQEYPPSRDELFEFMKKISHLWAFSYFVVAEREEIKAVVDQVDGRDPDLYSRILNRGVPHIIGGQNYRFVDENGEEVTGDGIDDLMDAVEGAEAFELTTTQDALIQTLRDTRSNMDDSAPLFDDWMGKDEFESTEQERRATVLRYFVHDVIPTYLSYGKKRGLSLFDLMVDLGDYWKRGNDSEAVQFLQNFATSYCFAELQYRRDIGHSSFDGSDVRDLLALAVAIPYSDVVMCDKEFADLAQQAGVDDAFDTVVTPDLTELPRYI